MGLDAQALETWADLIANIYEAAVMPERWANVVAGASEVLGGTSALMYGLKDPRHPEGWFGHRFPAEAMQRYGSYYHATNLWADEISRRDVGIGQPVLTDALIDPVVMARSEFYADYLSELDIHRACTVLLHKDPATASESHLCVYRAQSESGFDAESAAKLALLVPHLQRAQRIAATVADLDLRAKGLYAAIDALATGVLVLGARGDVRHANPVALGIARECDGFTLEFGRLQATQRKDADALKRLVSQACQRGKAATGGALSLVRPSGRRALQLVLTPLSERSNEGLHSDSAVAALCIVSGHAQQLQDARVLLPQLFGLTRAETRLAVCLLEGDSLADFVARRGVTLPTAKTQLAGLFAKTGTHRQGELVVVLRAACGHLRAAE